MNSISQILVIILSTLVPLTTCQILAGNTNIPCDDFGPVDHKPYMPDLPREAAHCLQFYCLENIISIQNRNIRCDQVPPTIENIKSGLFARVHRLKPIETTSTPKPSTTTTRTTASTPTSTTRRRWHKGTIEGMDARADEDFHYQVEASGLSMEQFVRNEFGNDEEAYKWLATSKGYIPSTTPMPTTMAAPSLSEEESEVPFESADDQQTEDLPQTTTTRSPRGLPSARTKQSKPVARRIQSAHHDDLKADPSTRVLSNEYVDDFFSKPVLSYGQVISGAMLLFFLFALVTLAIHVIKFKKYSKETKTFADRRGIYANNPSAIHTLPRTMGTDFGFDI